jgi:hypothetical protein
MWLFVRSESDATLRKKYSSIKQERGFTCSWPMTWASVSSSCNGNMLHKRILAERKLILFVCVWENRNITTFPAEQAPAYTELSS